MYIHDVSHAGVARLFPRRPKQPYGVLLHTTSGVQSLCYLLGGSIKDGRNASSDFLITRPGKVYQLAPIGHMSYHAGVCWWRGEVDRTNKVSAELVGIEIEQSDQERQVCTIQQHESLAALLLHLAHAYQWSPLRVWTHAGVAYPPGRRSDPRGLDIGLTFWYMADTSRLDPIEGTRLEAVHCG